MKERRNGLALLFVAILVPCVALGALGIRSLVTDASQTEARFRQQAESALDTAALAVEDAAQGLPSGVEGAITFGATADGVLVTPALPESRPDSRGQDAGTASDLLLSVLTDVDRFERGGDLENAAARLGEFLKGDPPSELAAAALTALGAVERKRGRIEAARDAWKRIVSAHPDARDSRGLKRSFAARLELVDSDQSSTESPASASRALEVAERLDRWDRDLILLYGDVVEDDRDAARPATAAFKREVRGRLAPQLADPGRAFLVSALFELPPLSNAEKRDRALAPERQLRAALAGGLRDWIAGGGRGVRTVSVPAETRTAADTSLEAVKVVVSVRDTGPGRVGGGIAPLDSVIASALARREVEALAGLGFPVAVDPGTKAGPASPKSLGDRFGGLSLGVAGADLEAFRSRERGRFLLTASLAAVGVVVAFVAALATARAVRRETKAARDRENFVAAVTHELKAPLASIRILAELLAGGGVEERKVREFADRVVGECDRLSRLVAGVLELARLESEPGFVVKLRTVDAGDLAKSVVCSFEPVARERGFSVALRIEAPGLRVSGDRDALESALLNLLDNAVKYADQPGEVELEVAAAGRGHAAFSILDRGRGVPSSETRRIFEPFIRLGDEMTRDRPGVGLGLALVSRIAAAHHGSVACEPREGGGSRFTVVLPLAAAGSS